MSFRLEKKPSGYEPNDPVCDAPKTPSHPLGDTSLPYIQCHSGELYYVFGNLGQFSVPFRDPNDLFFSQLTVDHWTAYAWTYNPNPSQAYLAARRYQTTLEEIQRSVTWEPVDIHQPSLRKLEYPSTQEPFEETEQCDFLHFPFNFYQ